jgi:hypothetical protein
MLRSKFSKRVREPCILKACILLAILWPLVAVSTVQADPVIVTNNTEEVNGTTLSPSALIDDPGPDGISFREALRAALSAPGPHTILFAPSLKGATIALHSSLPSLDQDGITIDGDVDLDGEPDITIDGGYSQGVAFRVFGSDVTIKGLAIVNFSAAGIQVFTDSQQGRWLIERITLQGNTISSGRTGIEIYNWGQSCSIRNLVIEKNSLVNNGTWGVAVTGASGSSMADNEIRNVLIRGNIISNLPGGNKGAVSIMAATNQGSTNNIISGVEISNNTISGHTYNNLLISAGNEQNCANNQIEDVLIRGNEIDGSPVTMEILGGVDSGANGNRISRLSIVENALEGGGIQLVGAQGSNAYQNGIETVFVGRNRISHAFANGIYIIAGSEGASYNEVTSATILNNLIVQSKDCGILLHGHDASTPNNVIEDVDIVNNTIVQNGNAAWAGGININSKSDTNMITGVRITNTILWNNEGSDSIRGSESPDSVTFSLLHDSRYLGSDGNFYSSPEFIDAAVGHFELQADSPCIDRGDNAAVAGVDLDIDNDPRVADGDGSGTATVDLGAHEYVPAVKIDGDMNGDGNVDLVDAVLVLQIVCALDTASATFLAGEDVNRDGRAGLEETIYILQVLADTRHEIKHFSTGCKVPGSPAYDTDSERFVAEVVDCELIVRHIDAVYNCCIKEISVSVSVSGNLIELYETEVLEAPCDCLCPYDITTDISNLSAGTYSIEIRNITGLLGTIKEVVIPECPVCSHNDDCEPGYYCAKKEGHCSATGRCRPKPDACITLWDPVCGCDGMTYGNACEAAMFGTSVAYKGLCRDGID